MPGRTMQPEDLYRLTLVGDAQLSPDGTRIAHVVKRLDREKNDYVSNIHLWDGEDTRRYTVGGKDTAPRWSPDGNWLAFLSGREGKGQIYLMPTAGGEAFRLTDLELGAGVPHWSRDSRSIAFCAPVSILPGDAAAGKNDDDEDEKPARTRVIERAVYKEDGTGFIEDRRTHLFVACIDDRSVRQITDGDWNETSPAWSPDGIHLAFTADRDPEWDLRACSDIWLVPAAGGAPRRVTDGRGRWWDPVFSPDGSRLAMVGYERPSDGEPTYFPQLWTIPRGGGTPENLLGGIDLDVGDSLSSDWSVPGEGSPQWTDDGIYLLISDRGTTNLYCLQDDLRPVTEGNHHVMDFSVVGNNVAYTVSDSTHPAEIATAEVGGSANSGQPVTTYNADLLAGITLVEPERVTFPGAEEVEIDGWLMKPANYQEGIRYPVLTYIHGGPVFAYGDTFFHEFQVLAAQGFGLFYCNPHGGSTYGQRFQVSIMGDWGNLDYADMMAGVDMLVDLPWVDQHRLGVVGGSYGGFLTNWIISHTDRFAAACTQRSICNMVSQGGTSDWAATRGERLGATPEGNPDRLWEMSPLRYVSQVTTPTLILHSERDDRCPIEQGEQWFMALKRLRIPTRFVRFPEESHGLSRSGKPSRRIERMRYVTEWFKRWL